MNKFSVDASVCLVRWDLILITNLVMDYQNDGVATALGTLFFILLAFPHTPSFPNLPEQTQEQKEKFHKSVGC